MPRAPRCCSRSSSQLGDSGQAGIPRAQPGPPRIRSGRAAAVPEGCISREGCGAPGLQNGMWAAGRFRGSAAACICQPVCVRTGARQQPWPRHLVPCWGGAGGPLGGSPSSPPPAAAAGNWIFGSPAPSCPCPRASRLQPVATDASGDPAGADLPLPDLLTRPAVVLKAALSFSHDFQGKEALGPRTPQPCPPTPHAPAGTAACWAPAGAGGAGAGSGPSLSLFFSLSLFPFPFPFIFSFPFPCMAPFGLMVRRERARNAAQRWLCEGSTGS